MIRFLRHRENLFFTGKNYAAAEAGRTKSDKASAMSDGGGRDHVGKKIVGGFRLKLPRLVDKVRSFRTRN